jgi:hypothetical protein
MKFIAISCAAFLFYPLILKASLDEDFLSGFAGNWASVAEGSAETPGTKGSVSFTIENIKPSSPGTAFTARAACFYIDGKGVPIGRYATSSWNGEQLNLLPDGAVIKRCGSISMGNANGTGANIKAMSCTQYYEGEKPDLIAVEKQNSGDVALRIEFRDGDRCIGMIKKSP